CRCSCWKQEKRTPSDISDEEQGDVPLGVAPSLTDRQGNVVERYLYDPYGGFVALDEQGQTLPASRYGWRRLHQGGEYDAISGTYHFRNRDYSPTLGRWLSPDPLGYVDGMSRQR